jgi:uncharacterized membrane protein YkoI
MKKLKLTGIAILFLGCTAFAQTNETKKKAEATFTKMFPSATEVKWDKENATDWEAEFKMNGKEYSAIFTVEGTWKETEHELAQNEIPKAVKATLAKDFSDYKIEEAEFSETKDGALYEFELEKGKIVMEIAINREGKVVKKEVQKEEDEEDND